MTKLPDYSEFLSREGMLQHIEEEWQKNKHIHQRQALAINQLCDKYTSVLEIGCATGNLAQLLNTPNYIGVDKNEDCIEIAINKNPNKHFITADVRTVETSQAEIVCAFAIMKHFSLDEWDHIMKKLIDMSTKYIVFDMPLHDYSYDDGEVHGHHHIWMSSSDLFSRLDKLGLVIKHIDYAYPIEPILVCIKS